MSISVLREKIKYLLNFLIYNVLLHQLIYVSLYWCDLRTNVSCMLHFLCSSGWFQQSLSYDGINKNYWQYNTHEVESLQNFIVFSHLLPSLIRVFKEVPRLVLLAFPPKPTTTAVMMALFPLPFLPTIKLTLDENVIVSWVWHMKLRRETFSIIPMSIFSVSSWIFLN